MFDDSSRDAEKMKPKRFEADWPPGGRQGFSLHNRKDIVSQQVQSPPRRIGKESLGRKDSAGQIIFEDIMNLLHGPTSLSLPSQ